MPSRSRSCRKSEKVSGDSHITRIIKCSFVRVNFRIVLMILTSPPIKLGVINFEASFLAQADLGVCVSTVERWRGFCKAVKDWSKCKGKEEQDLSLPRTSKGRPPGYAPSSHPLGNASTEDALQQNGKWMLTPAQSFERNRAKDRCLAEI